MKEKIEQVGIGIFYGLIGGIIGLIILAVALSDSKTFGNVTDWIGSIGTLLAVIVSLYLANRRPRPDLEANFNENVMMRYNGDVTNLMSWEIKNYSAIPTSITLIGAFVSEKTKVDTKSQMKGFLIIDSEDMLRPKNLPFELPAYSVETILYDFENLYMTLDEETKWKSLIFFCRDSFGQYYFSKNYLTSTLVPKMKERIAMNKASA